MRLIQTTGNDNMMAPEVPALMGITNEGRDIPVRQLADDGSDGRYVVSLVNIRKIHEFIFHRRQGNVLILHHADTKFTRLESVRYPRDGKPTSDHRRRLCRERLPATDRFLVQSHPRTVVM